MESDATLVCVTDDCELSLQMMQMNVNARKQKKSKSLFR